MPIDLKRLYKIRAERVKMYWNLFLKSKSPKYFSNLKPIWPIYSQSMIFVAWRWSTWARSLIVCYLASLIVYYLAALIVCYLAPLNYSNWLFPHKDWIEFCMKCGLCGDLDVFLRPLAQTDWTASLNEGLKGIKSLNEDKFLRYYQFKING